MVVNLYYTATSDLSISQIIKATYSSFKITTLMLHLIIIKVTYSSFKITTMILHLLLLKLPILVLK